MENCIMTPIKDPAESIVLDFDFSTELAGIDSAVVAVAVHGAGTDPAVATMIDGAVQISGTHVLQRVKKDTGVNGVDYKWRCTATSGANVIVRSDVMPVRTL